MLHLNSVSFYSSVENRVSVFDSLFVLSCFFPVHSMYVRVRRLHRTVFSFNLQNYADRKKNVHRAEKVHVEYLWLKAYSFDLCPMKSKYYTSFWQSKQYSYSFLKRLTIIISF